ncbi:metal ABC transporter solute-binding protein, Zn/Mn family [endosymbiont of Riftia pachyptila]|jgi:zinc transport system substrate-binding protein|uniref:High-affinity zinc uptake system protein ZnuA n=1 Tax=endosymbiont of Riftia pachyptila (vent Ph05) TaxID=1048808 RepID=G2DED6_9GAMM|nr:zinc ABC transporter, periplasmic-binding protein ZnuA [endosymbiont of Riftia pachyptila (vent Ph05)]
MSQEKKITTHSLAEGRLTLLLLLLVLLPLSLPAAQPIRVFVSALPQKHLVEQVGGDLVQVSAMVRPGYNPASYTPTPRQVAALTQADLFIRCGLPFEAAWMERIRATNPGMRLVDARDGLPLRKIEAHSHQHGDASEAAAHEALDPHIWTSPRLAKQMAAQIQVELSRLAPQHQAKFEHNYQRFAQQLEQLDREIKQQLSGLRSRRFMVFHPAWGYFADAYGLTQIAIEQEGKEPGARALTALIEQARAKQVRVIFVQPQFNRKTAQRLAAAIGGRVEPIDPLAENYIDNLRRVARLIAEANRR